MVGDDGGGDFHHRLPIRTCRGRDQDLAGLEAAKIALVRDQADLAGR